MNVCSKYFFIGGALFLVYDQIMHWLRHHDEANPRPRFFDHMITTCMMGTAAGAYYSPKPYRIFSAFLMTATIVAPALYWIRLQIDPSLHTHANIFYENGCSKDEIERFRMQDEIERQAH